LSFTAPSSSAPEPLDLPVDGAVPDRPGLVVARVARSGDRAAEGRGALGALCRGDTSAM
jgi:hypothetical protein